MSLIAQGMGEDGVALTPSGFNIKKIEMTRYDGAESLDITPLCVGITLIESIYSPTVVAKFNIKDNANFLEEFPIVGHEKIHLIIERIEGDTEIEKRIELKFVVTEYPLFGKSETQPNLSVYTLSAICPHAYYSSLTKISRQFKDNFGDEISTILKDDLKVDEKDIEMSKSITSQAYGVLPYKEPLKAIEWFRSRSCDIKESPLYVYQRINGKIHIETLNDMMIRDVAGVYKDSKFFATEVQSVSDYKERATRLLNVTSNLRFGRVFQSQAGAFASRTEVVDTSTKSFGVKDYTYNLSPAGYPPFSKTFNVNSLTLDKAHDAHKNTISLNTLAYGDTAINTNGLRAAYEQKIRAHTESLESMSQDIEIYGDFEYNPGNVIKLEFPRAIDPEEEDLSTEDEHPGEDKLLSGTYLVTSVQHEFKGGKYMIKSRVKRDSLDFRLI